MNGISTRSMTGGDVRGSICEALTWCAAPAAEELNSSQATDAAALADSSGQLRPRHPTRGITEAEQRP
jgi:hypothetical protein